MRLHLLISLCFNLVFSACRLHFRSHNSDAGYSLSEQKGGKGKVKANPFQWKIIILRKAHYVIVFGASDKVIQTQYI